MKNEKFKWGEKHEENFSLLKKKLSTAPVLALSNFNKLFEVKHNASYKGIRAIISQKGRRIEYMSEKLNEALQKWSIYDQEFYATLKTLIGSITWFRMSLRFIATIKPWSTLIVSKI